MSSRAAAGFTLVEMVMAIVIISVGLAGVLLALNTAVKSSADPLVHKQMLAAAEEMMEEVLLKPFAPPEAGFEQTNSAWPVNCGTAAAARHLFDDVSDYSNYATNSVCNIDGDPVDGLGAYSLQVAIEAASLGSAATGGVVDGSKVKKIKVKVTHGTESISLNGWRTWYACELPTVCPP